MAEQKHTPKKGKGSGFIVGSARFKKISAVEGIKFTPDMKGRVALSKSKDVTAEKRRKAIISAYRKA
jgi:hypothetical protein